MSLLFPEPKLRAERGSPVARAHPEADLQHACMQYLARALPADAIAHHSPGEGKRTVRAQRDLRRSGYVTGWPDIEVIYRGFAYFIELKAKGGSLSEVQRSTHRKLSYCGAHVIVCRSVDGVENALRELGLPLRGHVQ